MKKARFVLISICILFISIVATTTIRSVATNASDIEDEYKLYRSFLSGESTVAYNSSTISLSDIFRFDDADMSSFNRYALFDMNGDGFPELHIRSTGAYYIFTIINNEMSVWREESTYGYPLNNKAIIYTRSGGGPDHVDYAYSVFDYYGHNQLVIEFRKYDANEDGEYDENDYFDFDGVVVSISQWDELSEKYLTIKSDHIKWYDYAEGKLEF